MVLNLKLIRGLVSPPRLHGVLSECVRYKSGCETTKGENRCPKHITKFPCGKPKSMAKAVKKTKVGRPASMWLNPFCDPDAAYCPFNPRFDDIYYVESDKAKRRYWQTWVACPPLQIKPKKICCFDGAKRAPVKRRKPAQKPSTACPQPCIEGSGGPCPKLARRCHRDGRRPPTCKSERVPSNCVKPLTPYPSYSECDHAKSLPPSTVECFCVRVPPLCEVWQKYKDVPNTKGKAGGK